VLRQVRTHVSHTRIIVLSMHASESYVFEAVRQGASAYVLKDSPSSTLLVAVYEVRSGGHYLSPPLSQDALDAYLQKSHGAPLDFYVTPNRLFLSGSK
jgi:two-component system, NarL family, response regulator NreC